MKKRGKKKQASTAKGKQAIMFSVVLLLGVIGVVAYNAGGQGGEPDSFGHEQADIEDIGSVYAGDYVLKESFLFDEPIVVMQYSGDDGPLPLSEIIEAGSNGLPAEATEILLHANTTHISGSNEGRWVDIESTIGGSGHTLIQVGDLEEPHGSVLNWYPLDSNRKLEVRYHDGINVGNQGDVWVEIWGYRT